MDFRLSDEQLQMQEMVRKFARQELMPKAAELDQTCRFPRESFDKMGELGLLGLLVPEERIVATARIGVDYAGPVWSKMPWRFVAELTGLRPQKMR